jgi:hypothetical protein
MTNVTTRGRINWMMHENTVNLDKNVKWLKECTEDD